MDAFKKTINNRQKNIKQLFAEDEKNIVIPETKSSKKLHLVKPT